MEDRNKYYGLDEIGFVGTQDKRTSTQVNKDIQMTVKYIKAMKSGKAISTPEKNRKVLVKARSYQG